MENKIKIWQSRIDLLRGRQKDNGKIIAKLQRKILKEKVKAGEN